MGIQLSDGSDGCCNCKNFLWLFCCSFLSSSFNLHQQDKPAFIFCVEDRALFCQDCDEPIHSPGSLSANHQRFLATGIRVASSSICTKDNENSHLEPPNRNAQQVSTKVPSQQVPSFTPSWPVDDFLELTGYESPEKVRSNFIS